MSTFVNLLEVVYPVGSIYCSTSTTSPATNFGGTWASVTDAFLAAKGPNYITGSLAAYGGNKAISVSELPSHDHGHSDKAVIYDSGWGTHPGTDWALPAFGGSSSTYNSPFFRDFTYMSSTGGGAKLRSLLLFGQYVAQNSVTLKEGGRNVNLR